MTIDEAALHEKVIERCRAEGIHLIFDICLSREDSGNLVDSYRPARHGCPPSICVWRSEPDVPDDVIAETITLAHEFGHHLTHSARLISEAHEHARSKGDEDYALEHGGKTTNETQLVIADEELAWALARSTLALLDFSRWERFDRQRATALASYAPFRTSQSVFTDDEMSETCSWLDDVERAMDALELNLLTRSEAIAEMATLRAQLRSSKPKPEIIGASARALGHVIAEAYGAKAAAALIAQWPRALSSTKPEAPAID
jgi:hypothetical protein